MADYKDWSGKTAYDVEDNKIGSIADLYYDDDTAQPTWVTIKTGLFGGKVHFAPLQDAQQTDDGVKLTVTDDQVKQAPSVEVDEEITPDEEAMLYQYYQAITAPAADQGDSQDAVGHDTSGPTTDEAMTRSEEEIKVGTRTVETGRVRLKKYVVTEDVQMTVPVQREEVRLEREPITADNMDAAMDGPEISEEEHEVVLTKEEPVVQKEVVPKERVRIDKQVVQDEATVNDQVRKEQVDVDES